MYKLDPHCNQILNQYKELLPEYQALSAKVVAMLEDQFSRAGMLVAGLEHRVKTEESLAGKLQFKGAKYKDIYDITDILGLRVITFYSDDVDKVASILEHNFEIDWANSVDKRKIHDIDSFGYLSLHYICQWPGSPIRFEIQMRTILQHAWANMNHDTGYKTGVEVPRSYLRRMNRLAGLLEMADDEISSIRTEVNDYRRNIQNIVASGNLDEVELNGDSFCSYLQTGPFDAINQKIAALNQAEIVEVPLMDFLSIFKGIGLKTLGDVQNLKKDYGDAAFQMARFQLSLSDIDIISSSIGPQNLCLAYVMKIGGGKAGVRYVLDLLYGASESNDAMAQYLLEQAQNLPFMNQKSSE